MYIYAHMYAVVKQLSIVMYVAIRIFPYDVNKPTENGGMCKLYLVQLNAQSVELCAGSTLATYIHIKLEIGNYCS